eukprot:Gb_33340 [translate_table: standard]
MSNSNLSNSELQQAPSHAPKFRNLDTEEHNIHCGKILHPNSSAFAQTNLKTDNVAQKPPKRISSLADSRAPPLIKQSPPPAKKISNAEMNGVYVTKPSYTTERRAAGREDRLGSPAHYQYAHSPAPRASGEPAHGHRYSGRNADSSGSLKPNSSADSQRRGIHAEHHEYQSPLHTHYRGRLGNRSGAASPAARESRVSAERGNVQSAPATPRRSKVRGAATARPDETPDRSAPLPKFGDWNEKDPASAHDFTYIFNKRRQEKQTGGSAMIPPMTPGTPSQVTAHKQATVSHYKSLVGDFWTTWAVVYAVMS